MKLLAIYYIIDLLILKDFGLSPFDHESRLNLLDILKDRHGRKSAILKSQLSVSLRNGLIGDSTLLLLQTPLCIELTFQTCHSNTSHKIFLQQSKYNQYRYSSHYSTGHNLIVEYSVLSLHQGDTYRKDSRLVG